MNIQAVRALRRAINANRAWFNDAHEWAAADAEFDCGEFGGGTQVLLSIDARMGQLREAVAHRFAMTGLELKLQMHEAEYYEIGRLIQRG